LFGVENAYKSDLKFFQVSQNTGRIHLYSCIPGKDPRPRPHFQNFRPEEIEASNPSQGTTKEKNPESITDDPVHVLAILEFMKEWKSLRPIEKRKLLGKPLQLPLSLELSYLSESTSHNSEVYLVAEKCLPNILIPKPLLRVFCIRDCLGEGAKDETHRFLRSAFLYLKMQCG